MAVERSSWTEGQYVRFGSKADMCSALGDVRFTPESGHVQCTRHVRFVPIADICSVSLGIPVRIDYEE